MVPDLRTWRRALTWQSRGAGLPGAAVEGSGLASGLRERTQRSSPAPRFCGAFQAERSLFTPEGAAQGAVSSHIRAELRPLPGFFLYGSPRRPGVQLQAMNCGSGRPRKAKPGGGSWAGTVQREH